MSYKVRLPIFEGPFDLLVYLIENAQMSIYDIQVSEITSQYLDYISEMRQRNVNLSSEFMVLAAELIEIKSRMILPKPRLDEELLNVEDPRSQLAERLLAYKRCKKQSEMLAERERAQSGVFEKPQEDISVYLDNPDVYLNLSIEEFAGAFHAFLGRKQRIEAVRRHYTRVEREKVTMENRMEFIRRIFRKTTAGGATSVPFQELVPNLRNRYDVVVSFMSVLQMMRDRYLDAVQKKTYGEITVIAGERDFDRPPDEEGTEREYGNRPEARYDGEPGGRHDGRRGDRPEEDQNDQ